MTIYAAISLVCMTAICAFAWLMERRMHYRKSDEDLRLLVLDHSESVKAHQKALDSMTTEQVRLAEKVTTVQNRIGRA